MATTIIIGGGGGGGTNPQRASIEGSNIVAENGQTVAVFTNKKDAIRYLKMLQREAGEIGAEE